ncbi:MAG: hypothetical protein HQL20_11200, partial [Candidatus Omnitrophica bacterium]|nr:hypothetical protein [Candidatus Omnitrophota bacterium]
SYTGAVTIATDSVRAFNVKKAGAGADVLSINTVSSEVTITGSMTVTGDATIVGNAQVTQALTAGSATVTGLQTSGSAVVTGLQTAGSMSVSGNTTLTGNVGIGTTAPRAKMEVTGGVTITDDVTIGPALMTYASNNADLFVKGAIETDSSIYSAGAVVAGTVALTPSTVFTVTAADGINVVNRTFMQIKGDSLLVDIVSDPQIVPGIAGQVLYLQGVDSTKVVKFETGTGLSLSGGVAFSLGAGDMLSLMFDGSSWVETSRADN